MNHPKHYFKVEHLTLETAQIFQRFFKCMGTKLFTDFRNMLNHYQLNDLLHQDKKTTYTKNLFLLHRIMSVKKMQQYLYIIEVSFVYSYTRQGVLCVLSICLLFQSYLQYQAALNSPSILPLYRKWREKDEWKELFQICKNAC